MARIKTSIGILVIVFAWLALIVSISPAAARGRASAEQLYAWANPLGGPAKAADHTWVTDYDHRPACPHPDSGYWYATGGCHPSGTDAAPRALAGAPADLEVARCIAKPDDSTFQPGPATAQIVYGIDGVCHQICNRILAATATRSNAQITVARAGGYRLSRFVYGTHGTVAQWSALQAECKPARILTIAPARDLDAMITEAFGTRLVAAKRQTLHAAQDDLQGRIRLLGEEARSGKLTGRAFADRANEEVNRTLLRIGAELGREDFQRFFDLPAGEAVVLVNPSIAAEVRYR